MVKKLLWLGFLLFIVGCIVTATLAIPSPWNFAGEHSLTPPLDTVLFFGRVCIALGVILLIAAFVALIMRKSQEQQAKQTTTAAHAQLETFIQQTAPPEQPPPQSQQVRHSWLLDEDEPEIALEKDTNVVHCARCGMEYPRGQVVCLRCGMTVFE